MSPLYFSTADLEAVVGGAERAKQVLQDFPDAHVPEDSRNPFVVLSDRRFDAKTRSLGEGRTEAEAWTNAFKNLRHP